MSTIVLDSLQIDGQRYTTDAMPLEPYLDSLSVRPPGCSTPFTRHGYVATWTIHDGRMYLAQISSHIHARLFAAAPNPVAATWFSGFIRAWRGDCRYTGYPSRKFWDDEIVLEIVSGRVTRQWILDQRGVPDQTCEELRLSLPSCLLNQSERGA